MPLMLPLDMAALMSLCVSFVDESICMGRLGGPCVPWLSDKSRLTKICFLDINLWKMQPFGAYLCLPCIEK